MRKVSKGFYWFDATCRYFWYSMNWATLNRRQRFPWVPLQVTRQNQTKYFSFPFFNLFTSFNNSLGSHNWKVPPFKGLMSINQKLITSQFSTIPLGHKIEKKWDENLTILTRTGKRYSTRKWVIDMKWKTNYSNQSYYKVQQLKMSQW